MSTIDERTSFAQRVNSLCDAAGFPERGRQTMLAKQFQVTPKAARKWLTGQGLPETEVILAMARWAGVNAEWLLTGRGPRRGNLMDTRDLIFGEMMRKFPPGTRQEVADYLTFKIERSVPSIASEERARFITALDLLRKSDD